MTKSTFSAASSARRFCERKRQSPLARNCGELQMASPPAANEFMRHGTKEKSKPRPFKNERVGHPERQSPEKQNQFFDKYVQE
jgi:hypothetical protein